MASALIPFYLFFGGALFGFYSIGGLPAAAGLLFALTVFLVSILWSSEWLLVKSVAEVKNASPFEPALKRLGRGSQILPRIKIIEDPRAKVICARSLGSRGTLLITRGLIGQLSEAEIEQTLEEAVRFVSRKRHILVTALSLMLEKIQAFVPFNTWLFWYEYGNASPQKPLTVFGFLTSLILWPFCQALSKALYGLNHSFQSKQGWPLGLRGQQWANRPHLHFSGISLG